MNIAFNGVNVIGSSFIGSLKQYSTNNTFNIITNVSGNLTANVKRADDQVDEYAIASNVLTLDGWATAIEGELLISIVATQSNTRSIFELIRFNIERSVAISD